jgi:hypothetical protein
MCDVCSCDDEMNVGEKGCFSNVMHLIQWQGSGKIPCFRKSKDKRNFWHICNFAVVQQTSNEHLVIFPFINLAVLIFSIMHDEFMAVRKPAALIVLTGK